MSVDTGALWDQVQADLSAARDAIVGRGWEDHIVDAIVGLGVLLKHDPEAEGTLSGLFKALKSRGVYVSITDESITLHHLGGGAEPWLTS
jgi:hypothetical protein